MVRLSAPGQNVVTVNYTTAYGSAISDYEIASGTLSFAIGETTKVVRVELSEDTAAENLEHFRLNLSAPGNATLGQASAMVSIVDNDPVVATPKVFVRDVVVDEKAGTASFVVMLGGPGGETGTNTVSVDYATSNGTAVAGSDYVGKSGTLVFAPGESVKTVVVDITDDALAEGLERFNLALSNASGATIVDGLGVAEIGASDATAVALPVITVADAVVGEGDGYVDLVVRLSAPGQNVVTVNYTTAYGSAISDYEIASGTLSFAIGETTKVVRVELSEDTAAENLEHFRLNLSAPGNATLGQASAMVSIVDNDPVVATPKVFVRDVVVDEKAGTASFVVMLGGPGGETGTNTVSVDYATSNGTAVAGSDYVGKSGTLVFAPGESVKTVVVDITDDALAEGLERFNLALSNASGATIVDGLGVAEIGASDATAVALPVITVADAVVGEGDGYVDLVVRLSAPGQNVVTVNYTTAYGSAISDYEIASGTLSFAIGETTKVVRVELSEDTAAENLEHFRLNLSAPGNATLGQASAMVSIVDNDPVVATPKVFVRDVVVDEKAGTASFVVMLGGPGGETGTNTVSVDYATSNGTAVAGSDYVGKSGTLVFAPGESVKTVVVDITDDALAEGLERFNLALSNASGATIVDGLGVAEIGASDATAVALPVITVADAVVGEGDGYVDLVVRLSAPGQNVVTVNYTTAYGSAISDYEIASGTLSFAIGETTKVVRVELSEDTAAENLEHFRLNLSAPGNATLGQASAMVSIVDNDPVVATPKVFVRDVVVDEKAGTASFVVMLGGPGGETGTNTVSVDYATSNGTAVAGSDYVGKSGTLVFAPGESVKTVVVDITDDALAEGLERFNLALSNASGATIVDGLGVAEIGASDATAVALPVITVADAVVGEGDGYVDLVVRLSAPGQNVVTVNYTTAYGSAISDYEIASGTLSFAIGETTKVVRVELSEDTAAENLEHFRLNLSAPGNATLGQASAMVSIVDNDPVVATPKVFVRDVVVDEKAGTASFVVMLGGPGGETGTNTVSVDYATSNGTAVAGSDYVGKSGTLVFAPGESVKTVVVDITDDALAEGLERFNLALSNASGATIVDGLGVAEIGASDATAVALPVITVADRVVSEGDGYVDLVVRLSAPGQNVVTVNYATASVSALSGGTDYETASGTLNFAIGETTKVVRVELSENTTVENLESFRLNLSGAVNAILGSTSAAVTIVDNDTTSINVFSYGIGDDIYTVNNSTDLIVESANGGIDLVVASVSYTLPAEVENLTLTGSADINGTGNNLANILTGNAGNNLLNGDAGFDTAVFNGAKAGYSVVKSGANWVVTDTNLGDGNDGADTLSNIEFLQFSDSTRKLGSVASDFNGDGKSDLVWRNVSTGADAIWLSGNSATKQSVATIADPNWKIAGAGDFNGDGKSDLLWRNGSTGDDSIWLSGNNATKQSITAIADTNWKIAGLGDFNGDGKDDILWRNTSTGGDTIFLSGNSATKQSVATVADQNWKVAGIGDFDGDSKSDILWRNAATGSNTIWKGGNSATSQGVASVTDQNWKVGGVGDFNGDGKDDILWRNAANGSDSIWLGGNSATKQSVATVADQNWKVSGTGDYNGDGKDDILWRNTSTGADSIWLAGNSATTQAVATVTGNLWQLPEQANTWLTDSGSYPV